MANPITIHARYFDTNIFGLEDSVADCGRGGKSLTFYLVLFQLLLFSFLEIVFSGWSEGSGADCGRGEALYHPTSSHGTEQTNYYFGGA